MDKKVILWGTGRDANYFMTYHHHRLLKVEIVCVCDSSEEKWGKSWETMEIISPSAAFHKQFDYIIVLSDKFYQEIEKAIIKNGIPVHKILSIGQFERKYWEWNVESKLGNFYKEELVATLSPYNKINICLQRTIRDFEDYVKIDEKYRTCALKIIEKEKRMEIIHSKKEYHDDIWVCWLQGFQDAPPLVKACIRRIYQVVKGTIHLITEQNYMEYVDVDDMILKKRKLGIITNEKFANILRLLLLIKYGGIWIDATVLVIGEGLPEFMYTVPLFMYKRSHTFAEGYMDPRPYCNWLICSEKNALFLRCLYEMHKVYWQNETDCPYIVFHMLMTLLLDCEPELADGIPEIYFDNTFLLLKKLRDVFDYDVYKNICEVSPVQKMSSKDRMVAQGSFCEYIVQEQEV